MNKETFERICNERGLNAEDVLYNCGYDLNELKSQNDKIYKPKFVVNGKAKYEFSKEYEIILEDCI